MIKSNKLRERERNQKIIYQATTITTTTKKAGKETFLFEIDNTLQQTNKHQKATIIKSIIVKISSFLILFFATTAQIIKQSIFFPFISFSFSTKKKSSKIHFNLTQKKIQQQTLRYKKKRSRQKKKDLIIIYCLFILKIIYFDSLKIIFIII